MHRSATTSVRASPAPADVLHQESDPSEEITLTTREKEVLQWVFAGKSSWEISVIFSCTEAGVNYHLTNSGAAPPELYSPASCWSFLSENAILPLSILNNLASWASHGHRAGKADRMLPGTTKRIPSFCAWGSKPCFRKMRNCQS